MEEDMAPSVTIKDRIIQYMNQTLLSTLVTVVHGRPVSRMMLFGNDKRGTVWLCTRADSSILDEIRQFPHVALSIFREETLLDEIVSLSVEGEARIVEDPMDRLSLEGFDILGRKSPRIGDIPHAGEADRYRIVIVSPTLFRFHSWADHVKGVPPVTLRRKSGASTI